MNTINKLFGDETAVLDFIFFHGLTGDPFETWTTECGSEVWPNWFDGLFQAPVAAFTIGYNASVFERWAKKEMDIHQLAGNILEQLVSNDVGKRPIAIITHSLGGLLAKEMLRTARESDDEDYNNFADNVRFVAFIATPHEGAPLASAVKFLAPRLTSKHIKLISNDSGFLTALNQSFRDLTSKSCIKVVAYYETYKTNNVAIAVTRESADPGVTGCRPVAIDADHISICKPANKEDPVFGSLRRHLKTIVADCPSSADIGNGAGVFEMDDYGKSSITDRRDLMQKLIDAGREHEYKNANNLQNKFAQRYYKHGLYTQEKTKSDALLASVEQRFLTHVFAARICKGANDDEIAQALQQHVIDPLSSPTLETGRPNPAIILQALYFLTEQCHIQWDPS